MCKFTFVVQCLFVVAYFVSRIQLEEIFLLLCHGQSCGMGLTIPS